MQEAKGRRDRRQHCSLPAPPKPEGAVLSRAKLCQVVPTHAGLCQGVSSSSHLSWSPDPRLLDPSPPSPGLCAGSAPSPSPERMEHGERQMG